MDTCNNNSTVSISNKLLLDVSTYDNRERRESGFVEGDFSDSFSDNGSSRRNSDNSSYYDSPSSPDIFCLEDLEEASKKIVANSATMAANSANTKTESSHSRNKRGSKKKKKRLLCESLSHVAHFTDVYALTGEVLGEGSYGRVEACRHNLTHTEYAVKIISKQCWHFSRPKILKEIELYYLCQGKTEIIQMVEYFEEEHSFYLVFEKAEGGPLLDQIQKRVRFTEAEAAAVIRDLATALSFLHGRGIAHRDLKPENVLCAGSGNGSSFLPVKLCDFDLCSAVYQTITTPKLQSPVGSVEYMAPEVVEAFAFDMDIFDYDDADDDSDDLELTYDKRCDLWSLGVIAYILLCGYLPFSGHCGRDCGWADRGEECQVCQHQLFLAIKNGTIHFPEEEWSTVSDQAKDLIRKLLVREASDRIEASQVLTHPWVVAEGECCQPAAMSDNAMSASPVQPPEPMENNPENPTPAHVLRRRHKSVHDLFYSMEILKQEQSQHETSMKKSATVLDFQPTPNVDIVPSQCSRDRTLPKRMHRQTSLVVFPEDISPTGIDHNHTRRWEF